jgi:hypothetical protein
MEGQMRLKRAFPTLAVVAGVLISLAVMSYGACAVGRHADTETALLASWRPPGWNEAWLACSAEYALRSKEANDVVFIGDSSCRHDIVPAEFTRLTGLSSFNLAMWGALGPDGMLVVATLYLQNHPKPKALVFCITPQSLECITQYRHGQFPRRFISIYGAHVEGLPADLAAETDFAERCHTGLVTLLRAARPSARHVREIPFRDNPTQTLAIMKEEFLETKGHARLGGPGGDDPIYRQGKQIQVEPAWTRCVSFLSDECHKRGVRFILRMDPTAASMKAHRKYDTVESWLDEVSRDCPHAIVAEPRLLWWERKYHWDFDHLNTDGVARFMPVVAKDVLSALGKTASEQAKGE